MITPYDRPLAQRIWDAARITGTFQLRSGAIVEEYFDKYRFESEPGLLAAIGEAMLPLLPAEDETLSGLELGGVPIATVLSQLSGRRVRFVRKAPKPYGTQLQVEGGDLVGVVTTVVEDVVTSGGAILDGVAALREAGAVVTTAVCVVDREEGGFDKLAAAGIELRPLFTATALREAGS